MGDKIDRELEKGMIQALNGLKKLRRIRKKVNTKKRFGLLTKIVLNKGYMNAPHLEAHQIDNFRANGLIIREF